MVLQIAAEANIIIESVSSDNGEEKDCKAQTPISKNSEDAVAGGPPPPFKDSKS
jgi:hypothetical protein